MQPADVLTEEQKHTVQHFKQQLQLETERLQLLLEVLHGTTTLLAMDRGPVAGQHHGGGLAAHQPGDRADESADQREHANRTPGPDTVVKPSRSATKSLSIRISKLQVDDSPVSTMKLLVGSSKSQTSENAQSCRETQSVDFLTPLKGRNVTPKKISLDRPDVSDSNGTNVKVLKSRTISFVDNPKSGMRRKTMFSDKESGHKEKNSSRR
ncbi:hypothetical protein EAI_03902 [Harpegnathos saltator]|uniref:Uncharacterized protein n=1 Tax=Harpegnathos saltator TaxID=610380 RepID=E2B5J9_HARSA|nr:hypothetical protein EAI_03902 [Harpegnathos saltator]